MLTPMYFVRIYQSMHRKIFYAIQFCTVQYLHVRKLRLQFTNVKRIWMWTAQKSYFMNEKNVIAFFIVIHPIPMALYITKR